MKKQIILVLLALLLPLYSCLGPSYEEVYEEVRASWQGLPVSRLDIHTYYLTLPVEKRYVDGDAEQEIRIYTRKMTEGSSRVTCTSKGSGYRRPVGDNDIITDKSNMDCTETYNAPQYCKYIFHIKDNAVADYQEAGNCWRGSPMP